MPPNVSNLNVLGLNHFRAGSKHSVISLIRAASLTGSPRHYLRIIGVRDALFECQRQLVNNVIVIVRFLI